jgi:molecular chaperone Hsp33
LLDWSGEELVTRLFHEDGVQFLGARALRFACSCSRERVEAMLTSLGEGEARAAVTEGEAVVRCEFCGQSYRFSPAEIEALFEPGPDIQPAPERTQ